MAHAVSSPTTLPASSLSERQGRESRPPFCNPELQHETATIFGMIQWLVLFAASTVGSIATKEWECGQAGRMGTNMDLLHVDGPVGCDGW
jgi:hypothetical protein